METILAPENDWWPEVDQTIRCICGAEFRGRDQIKKRGDKLVHLIDRECPNCGPKVQITSSSSDPERWTIG